MPNFFGYQRFGSDGENYKIGEAILLGKRKERNVKLKRLYINAYQSHMFNLWLSRRLEINWYRVNPMHVLVGFLFLFLGSWVFKLVVVLLANRSPAVG